MSDFWVYRVHRAVNLALISLALAAIAFKSLGSQAVANTPPIASAKVFGIRGVVRDTAGMPLEATEIRLGSGAVTLSDENGAFEFAGVPSGNTEVAFIRIGYSPASLAFEGPENVVVSLAAKMKPLGTQLGTVVVEGKRVDQELAANGFYQREKMRAGTFFTPERMARNEASLSTLVTEVVGVRILGGVRGRIPTVRRPDGAQCAMFIFVDGQLYPEANQVGIDALVNEQQVKAIEVYKNLDDAPFIIKGRLGNVFIKSQTKMGNCGIILLWTE